MIELQTAKSVVGSLAVPGDKSISHRAAMLAAIANGTTLITNFATGADCRSTLDVLAELGVNFRLYDTRLSIEGVGLKGFRECSTSLDCGNSGTTMRLMAGLLAGQGFSTRLVGDRSLEQRPMDRIAGPLRRMGAEITTENGKPPLSIKGTTLHPVDHVMSIASAQVKSCVMLAGLYADGTTRITESVKTRDHTERMLRHFGHPIRIVGDTIEVDGRHELTARDVVVPGDPSSAAFFAAAAAMIPGSSVTIKDVSINPTRIAFFDLLAEIGAGVDIRSAPDASGEPYGDITVKHGEFKNQRLIISGDRVVDLIDELPLVAVLATKLPGGLVVENAAELRKKETDRIAATVINLQKMNAAARETSDGLAVDLSQLSGCEIETCGDHRIAMAFAVAALVAKGKTTFDDDDCVNVSFPRFFDLLKSVVR